MSKRRTALVAVLGLIVVAGVFMAIAAMAPVKPAAWGMSADANTLSLAFTSTLSTSPMTAVATLI